MNELQNSPIADFDWEAYEHGDTKGERSHEELEHAYEESLNSVKDKEVIEGTIIALNKREAVVNIDYKSDGIIPMSEFRYNPDIKVGDKVEVFIENQEDRKGQLILSHKKARASRSWERVNAALENNEIIKGYIKCRTKGGMIVDVFGIEAFLPGSQIDVKPIRDYDIFVGKTMEFRVVKINEEFRNVVVSHKALIEAELEQQKREIISKLEKGQVLEGTVKNPAKSLPSTRSSTSLSLTSTTTKSASPSASSSSIPIHGMPSTPTSRLATRSKAKLSSWPTTAHSSRSLPA